MYFGNPYHEKWVEWNLEICALVIRVGLTWNRQANQASGIVESSTMMNDWKYRYLNIFSHPPQWPTQNHDVQVNATMVVTFSLFLSLVVDPSKQGRLHPPPLFHLKTNAICDWPGAAFEIWRVR